ncbi:hypothetical protein [Clostridium sp.]|jgi:hypothetical protein|uniref:hypothetical protein n=1 Tax=Clostridium sp. TaxID=1506 RepID=UPI0025843AE2|nr:hypothetical protein [Clostridium sp.]MDF2503409.1 hypothetical protein [Clostridium sp.]
MKNKYITAVSILFIVVGISTLFKLYFTNRDLLTLVDEAEKKYQELRVQKSNDDYMEARMLKLSVIEDTFKWLKDTEKTNMISLENYDGDNIDIKEDTSINKIILQGLYLGENIITPDDYVSAQLHNDHRLHYTLQYHFKDNINEILIFDDGTIKYKDSYYRSPILLSAAQSLMPIEDEANHIKSDALSVMLNSTMASYANYMVSEIDKSEMKQGLTELWDNAVRLRASAHFINKNMIKVGYKIEETDEMMVTKSSGYCEGKQVGMYIFAVNGGEVDYVKLVYDDVEEIYKLTTELSKDNKYLYFNNIWTAD